MFDAVADIAAVKVSSGRSRVLEGKGVGLHSEEVAEEAP